MKWSCVLLLAAACGEHVPNADFRSAMGIRYYWDDSSFEPAQIEAEEEYLLLGLPEEFNSVKVDQALSRTTVHVQSDPIPLKGYPKGVNGYQDHGFLMVRNMGCVFNSALGHEIFHYIQEVHGIYDINHEDPFWKYADSAPAKCIPN